METGFQIVLTREAETAAFGQRLASWLRAGDVVLLGGDLGAGKTTLARAVIETLTGADDVPSPTYTIIQTYDLNTGGELWHADLYRVEDEAELDELGLEDAFEDAICLIEWPDRLGAYRPQSYLALDITLEAGEETQVRRVRITGRGAWEERLDDFRRDSDTPGG